METYTCIQLTELPLPKFWIIVPEYNPFNGWDFRIFQVCEFDGYDTWYGFDLRQEPEDTISGKPNLFTWFYTTPRKTTIT